MSETIEYSSPEGVMMKVVSGIANKIDGFEGWVNPKNRLDR
jgi:hypothetical protein